jgi:hypothetical protein
MAYMQTLGIVINMDLEWPKWFKIFAINISFPFTFDFQFSGYSEAGITLSQSLAPALLLIGSTRFLWSPELWRLRLVNDVRLPCALNA